MTSILTISDLRKKTPADLDALTVQLQEQLRALQFEVRTSQLKKVHQVKVLRRSIAKVLTVKSELTRTKQK
ncbi:MAG: 50S ribosomal protein L29 [bacterium]|nr:50S ribosomal protein L29 [bacterium]